VKFILSNGEQLREKLERFPFPAEFHWKFLVAKILVAAVVDEDNVVAACGVRNVLNQVTWHVREGYRGQGIGKQVLEKTIRAARERNLSFLMGTVAFDNAPSLHVTSKVGFRMLVQLKESGLVFLMCPLSLRGELAYTLLHVICPRLPNALLERIAGLVEKRIAAESGQSPALAAETERVDQKLRLSS